MNQIDTNLANLNITLPNAAAPAANYVPWVISGNQIIVSGQLPMVDGKFDHAIGTLGDTLTPEQGEEFARQCAINIIAQLKSATNGDLGRITRIVRLGGFVASTPDFGQHPAVINGASNLMVDVFGKEIGSHARAAVGSSSLPFGVGVEIDCIAEFK